MEPPAVYEPTTRTTPSRSRERVGYDRAAVHAVLDEALICHLGVIAHGEPLVLPTIHARVGDIFYLHGSTGAGVVRLAEAAGGSLGVCVTVTLLDGLGLGGRRCEHWMTSGSGGQRGRAGLVSDRAERDVPLRAIVERFAPGRSEESRPGNR